MQLRSVAQTLKSPASAEVKTRASTAIPLSTRTNAPQATAAHTTSTRPDNVRYGGKVAIAMGINLFAAWVITTDPDPCAAALLAARHARARRWRAPWTHSWNESFKSTPADREPSLRRRAQYTRYGTMGPWNNSVALLAHIPAAVQVWTGATNENAGVGERSNRPKGVSRPPVLRDASNRIRTAAPLKVIVCRMPTGSWSRGSLNVGD